MQNNKPLRASIIFFSIVAFICAGILAYVWYEDHFGISYETIDYIKERQIGPKKFLDMDDVIHVESYEDLGFIQNSNRNLTLYYGGVVIKITDRCLKSKEWRKRIGEIGIKIGEKKDDRGNYKYKITYWGDPIAQWTHRSGE